MNTFASSCASVLDAAMLAMGFVKQSQSEWNAIYHDKRFGVACTWDKRSGELCMDVYKVEDPAQIVSLAELLLAPEAGTINLQPLWQSRIEDLPQGMQYATDRLCLQINKFRNNPSAFEDELGKSHRRALELTNRFLKNKPDGV